MEKKRLDMLLVELGHFESREKAKAAIMAGTVIVEGNVLDKPGTKVVVNVPVEIKGKSLPYVSRGGLKLEKAIQGMNFDVTDKVVLDVGASTGGFTDCALQNGAIKVYAVDVGYGQLAWKLRQDPRVVCMERTNIRYLEQDALQELPDIATIDVAFISLGKVLPQVHKLIKEGGQVLALIKPQFEAGKDKVGKKGVVRDPEVHRQVILKVISESEQIGFMVKKIDFSPVKGPEGNIEYLCWLVKEKNRQLDSEVIANKINQVVEAAHSDL